jgi:hypothetical protein
LDREKAFNRGSGVLHSRRIANNRKQRFNDAALAVGHLQNGFARDLFDGRLKGTRQRPVHDSDGDDNSYSQSDTQEGKQGPQTMTRNMAPRESSEQPQH